MTNIAPYAVYTPKITSFSYTKKIEVGTPVPLSIKLTETSGTSSARTYTVKVFCTRSGKEWQVATTTMTILQQQPRMSILLFRTQVHLPQELQFTMAQLYW